MANLKISVVIVNYNSSQYLIKCIDSIFAKMGDILQDIIIIDSKSTDSDTKRTMKLLQKKGVKIKVLDENKGFGYACNQGVKLCKTDYVLILNADTVLLKLNEISLEKMLADKQPTILAPVIIENGNKMVSTYKLPGFISDAVFRDTGLDLLLKIHDLKVKNGDKINGWILGAALLVNRVNYQKIGGFDEDFFLYFEDIDLSARVLKNGYQMLYSDSLTIEHVGGGSSASLSWRQVGFRYTSRHLYWFKHVGTFKQTCNAIIEIIVILSKIFRLAFQKRERVKLKGYLYALKLYLTGKSNLADLKS